MPSFYTYLICTLPNLQFGMKPPFSFEKLLQYCQRFIPDSDIEIIKKSSITDEYIYDGMHPTLKRWQMFDTALRNELVKIRATRKHIDPAKYMRKDDYTEMYISHLAMNAHRNPSIQEAERMLDRERWHFLDELSFGHYFDIDILIIYALKLLILERWESVNTADKPKVLEETLMSIPRGIT